MGIGHTAKVIAKGMPALVTGGKPGARAGDEQMAWHNERLQAPATVRIESDAFAPNQPIPAMYSADGGNISPPLRWTGASGSVGSWALIVEDPDAPLPKPFVHWLVYNIPATVTSLPPAIKPEKQLADPPILQGRNSTLKLGYAGCAPPKGDDLHHYHFQIFALDRSLDIEPGAGRSELLQAMEGHVIARGDLIGTYRR